MSEGLVTDQHLATATTVTSARKPAAPSMSVGLNRCMIRIHLKYMTTVPVHVEDRKQPIIE